MRKTKSLFLLNLFLLFFGQLKSQKLENINNYKQLKITANAVKEYRVISSEAKNFGRSAGGMTSVYFDGDTSKVLSYASGYRLGFEYDMPFNQKGVFKKFSITLGLCFQNVNSFTKIYATSNVSPNGNPIVRQDFKLMTISIPWLLNFQYHKIRLSVGFNVNLLTLKKITNTYVGGEVIRVNKKGENYGIYSCFEVPVANKGNLTLRLFSLVAGPAENIMIGGGLAYRIYKK
jgi:hypothetical protein